MDLKLYEQISSLHGGSGNEHEVRKFMKEHLASADSIIQDGMGGIFGVFKGSKAGPKIMICAHMDEISAMIVGIKKNGMLKIIPVGGINPEAFVAQNVYVNLRNGEKIKGVISSIPPHISNNNKITFEDLLLDIGCDDDEAAKKFGVNIGDFVTPVENFYLTCDNKKMVNKAWDDRLGCAIVLDLVNDIKNMEHPNEIIMGGTVQEEVGLRGANVASKMIAPDLFITIDVSPAGDYLDRPDEGRLGGGFLVRYFDPGCIMPPKLLSYFTTIAEKNEIPYQYFRSKGGTDAGIAQYAGSGTLATTVGIPGRYIHSPATMVHLDDIEAAKKFILKLVVDFDENTLKSFSD